MGNFITRAFPFGSIVTVARTNRIPSNDSIPSMARSPRNLAIASQRNGGRKFRRMETLPSLTFFPRSSEGVQPYALRIASKFILTPSDARRKDLDALAQAPPDPSAPRASG